MNSEQFVLGFKNMQGSKYSQAYSYIAKNISITSGKRVYMRHVTFHVMSATLKNKRFIK